MQLFHLPSFCLNSGANFKNFSLNLQWVCLLGFIGLMTSCQQSVNTDQVEKLNAELTNAKTELENTKAALVKLQSSQNYPLVHLVYFDMKDAQGMEGFINDLKKLKAIKEVKSLQIGHFKDLGDQRALSEFELVMQMGFNNEADYQSYQKHSIHLALKKKIAPYLAAPPTTYDFTLQ